MCVRIHGNKAFPDPCSYNIISSSKCEECVLEFVSYLFVTLCIVGGCYGVVQSLEILHKFLPRTTSYFQESLLPPWITILITIWWLVNAGNTIEYNSMPQRSEKHFKSWHFRKFNIHGPGTHWCELGCTKAATCVPSRDNENRNSWIIQRCDREGH